MQPEYPEMKCSDAITARIRHFTGQRACVDCGDKRRYLITWTPNGSLCPSCCPDVNVLSKSKVMASEKSHNTKVQKKRLKSWSIPVVFSGMSTNTR